MEYSVLEACERLIKSKEFVFAFVAHSLVISYYFSVVTLIMQIIGVYGFSSDQASYLMTAFQFTGIAGGLLSSMILTRLGTSYFKSASLVIITFTILSKQSQY